MGLLYGVWSQGQIVFVDSFTTNQHNWSLPNEPLITGSIEGGVLELKGRSEALGYFFARPIEISDSVFEFSVNLTHKGGADNMAYGLVWGLREDNTEFNAFFISANGKYTILRMRRGEFSEIKRWTESRFIERDDKPNTLKIVRQGHTLRYYINDRQVLTGPYEPGRGNRMGIALYGNVKLWVDDLLVQIPEP
ncbi:MAG: hypothetical protein SF053_08495 [Bacteroidia bacterium]|nr:hypothetical protein [Bacteroidia bacterium]